MLPTSAPQEEARAHSPKVMLPALEGAAGASAARAEFWLGDWLRERCLACVSCKWSWMGFATVALVLLEVHQHVVCNMSSDADVEIDVSPDKWGVGRCATVMQAHEYTEMFCKMGLGATFARYLLAGRIIVERRSTLPAVAYWIWPGLFVCVKGEDCGEYCAFVESVMEHGCCFAVLLGALDFFLEFAAGALREGFWGSCRETAAAARDTGPGGSPRTLKIEAARAPSRYRACLLWATYIGTGLLYASKTWHSFDVPGLDYAFRLFDTYCHANILGAVVLWICELTHFRTTSSDLEEGVLVFTTEGFVASSRDELCAG